MSKPIIPLLIAFLVLWLFGGAYWLSNNLNNNHAKNTTESIDYKLVIKDGDFTARAKTIFAFQISDADIIVNEEQLSVLKSLASYLNKNTQKQLRLIAYFGNNESYYGEHPNLGIARAETVKSILVKRGAPETRINVESKSVEKLILNENGLLSGGIEFDIFDKDISNSITEAIFLKEKIFYFEKNSYQLLENEELVKYVADLKQYMVDEKESDVIITGFRNTKENDSMALLRAEFVKDVFVNQGIETERISIEIMNEQIQNTKENNGKNDKKVEIKVF